MFRQRLLKIVLRTLKSYTVEKLLMKFVGRTAGLKAWFASMAIKYVFDEIAEPVIQTVFRKGQLVVDKITGEITYRKLVEAQEDDNKEDYIKYIGRV